MDNRIKQYLFDIEQSIEDTALFMASINSFEEYEKDKLIKRAVEREIEIIGEAMNRILKIDPSINIQNKVVDKIWTDLAKVKENLISNMGHDMLPLLLLLRLWGYAPRLLQYYPFYEDFGALPQSSAAAPGSSTHCPCRVDCGATPHGYYTLLSLRRFLARRPSFRPRLRGSAPKILIASPPTPSLWGRSPHI